MPETLTDAQKVLRNDTGKRMAAALEALASEVEPSTVIAPEYDAEQTYAVGDLVMRRSVLYRCTTPIDTPEEWTAAHWTATSVSDEYRPAAEQDGIDANLMALGLTGASVGDIVRVAAVDTNGKPTSWEHVPLLAGNLPVDLKGKKVSIIGDSISTFLGYNPSGYPTHYPNASGTTVTNVNLTWWKQVLDFTGATLEVNAAYSGSSASSVSPPSFYDRCSASLLGSPDVIFVELGTNDSAQNVDIGAFDFGTAYASLSEETFASAYIKGIKALKALYPSATIICIALNMGKKYMQAIEIISKQLSCYFAYSYNYQRESGSHPGALGMHQIANQILSFYGSQQLYNGVLTGDTYTNGKILFSDQYNAGDALPATVNTTGFYWKDADDSTVATILMRRIQNGSFEIDERVQKYANGQRVALEQFERGIDANNHPYVRVSTPAVWRAAFGICVDFSADLTYPNGSPAEVVAMSIGNLHVLQIRSAGKYPWAVGDVIATIPSALAPSALIAVPCMFSDTAVGIAALKTNGELAITSTTTTGNTRALTQVFWIK